MPESVASLSPAPRKRVRGIKEYHPPLGSRDALRLDFNENTLACSPKVREVLAQISTGDLTRYPEREPVEAFAAEYLGLAAGQFALTNGVDEAIHVLFEAFLDADDELLLPVPTYTMYEVYASATDARAVTIQAGDDLQFPYERLRAAVTPSRTLSDDVFSASMMPKPMVDAPSAYTRKPAHRSGVGARTEVCWGSATPET